MKTYKVIGIMSGTSLDALDLAYCHIRKPLTRWEFEIVKTRSIPYDKKRQTRLKEAISLSAEQLLSLHNEYGIWLGEQARRFAEEENLEVDFLSSHGHTVHHQPEKGLTFQVGSGQHLANASGMKTICDFRTNDVALGGQGAPLVPIGDHFLFGSYDFCLNLGGICNISFAQDEERIAYDIGVANMLLNHITAKEGLAYDKGGMLARKGKLIPSLLKSLNNLSYYAQPFPKSTGYEWFSKEVAPIVDGIKEPMESLLYTCVHHIAEQIARAIDKIPTEGDKSLLITGGGGFNSFLMEVLQEKLGNDVTIQIPSDQLIEFKEALVFAFMGVLRLEQEINVLHSVTGASRDSSSGVLYLPA
ncbi:MAG: anhydro-N-acetylmuramic acid kinase [Muriicola sp.]|nr:anhydro-N-acetylmuramic acid kinase [Muriicola sp.]NNK35364.1 anhydro-N-acetylmuramic acid kinase [Eudoraea sp.]